VPPESDHARKDMVEVGASVRTKVEVHDEIHSQAWVIGGIGERRVVTQEKNVDWPEDESIYSDYPSRGSYLEHGRDASA
jgi:hypothetical protein